MSVPRIVAFPDSNLFMHFRSLNEIDWCEFLQASAVEIKIAPVVTSELEKQKTLNPLRKLRERADNVLKFAVGIGGSYGPGVMTCRGGIGFYGPWGAPTMVALEGNSAELQLSGAQLISFFS